MASLRKQIENREHTAHQRPSLAAQRSWDLSPLKVMLLFGITGSLAEASINLTSLIGGFWVFGYGLMVSLPACTVPQDRGAKPLRWWHGPLAVFLPFLGAIPGGLVATVLR